MASGKSEDELLKEIAEKMVKNQISFDSKSEDEKKEFLWKIDMVASSQMVELQKSFNTLMGNIEGEIPENARIVVLEGIMNKVESEKLKTIDTAFLSEEVKGYAATVVNEIVKNQDEPIEKNDDMKYSIQKNEIEKNEKINDDGYISNKEIKDNVDSAKEVVRKLDKDEIEKLISKANDGNIKSRAEIIAIMSVSIFTKTNKTFEEMTENDRVRALTQFYSMAVLNEDINSENLIILAEELSKIWGAEFITEDSNGKKIIDKEKIELFAKENNIDYGTASLKSIYENAKAYENLRDYRDMEDEIEIDVAKINLNSKLDFIYSKIKEGESFEDYSDELRSAFEINLDGSIRAIDETVVSWNRSEGEQVSPECAKYQLFLLQEGMNLYRSIREENTDANIDQHIKDNFYGMLDKSVLIMKKNKIQDKQLLDIMLELEPEKTQEILAEYDFFGKNEQDNIQNDLLNETPRTRLDNLYDSLVNREQIKGIENVLDYTNNYITNENNKQEAKSDYAMTIIRFLDNRENSYEENERLARKKLFTTIISNGFYNESMLKSMIEIDSTTIKEMIDELIESQNSREGDKLSTIMELSNSLKQVSESKVISADKVNIEDVVRNIQENDSFDKDGGDAR